MFIEYINDKFEKYAKDLLYYIQKEPIEMLLELLQNIKIEDLYLVTEVYNSTNTTVRTEEFLEKGDPLTVRTHASQPKRLSTFINPFSCFRKSLLSGTKTSRYKEFNNTLYYSAPKKLNLIKQHRLNSRHDEMLEIITKLSKQSHFSAFENEVQQKALVRNLLSEKLTYLEENKKIEDLLKLTSDKFSEYFNIERILQNQEEKLKNDLAALENLKSKKYLNLCKLCFSRDRNTIFYPCLHFVCCDKCSFNCNDTCLECNINIIERKAVIL
jgi:ribosomal protein L14E/L6E/L27E